MYSSMWFMSIMAILMADVRTGALIQKEPEPRQCFHCIHNDTACRPDRLTPAPCPGRQHCATVATSPDFKSALTCAAAAAARQCSLVYSTKQILQLTCTCTGHRCNAPFTAQLQNELVKFTPNITNDTDLTDAFFKNSKYSNVTMEKLYESITFQTTTDRNHTKLPIKNIVVSTMKTPVIENHSNEIDGPRAEALKHEATEPSDDDEDDGEGSGSFEETRSQRRPASAPAAPSSFLPANENRASSLLINIPAITALLFIIL